MGVFVFLLLISSGNCQIREFILGEFPVVDSTCKNLSGVNYYSYNGEYFEQLLNLKDNVLNLSRQLETKVVIHGFTENYRANWYKNIARAYSRNKKVNLILVDWSSKSKKPYINAVKESYCVGCTIGDYLIKLNEREKINLERTHIIGHSLGSHVAGFVGQFVYRESGRKLNRITALDPAGPLFEFPFIGKNDRLSKGDAAFVDVVHTDSGILGFRSSLGDADYFANGGFAIQPGCQPPSIENFNEYVCSHQRSHQYFIESITSESFIAKPCDSWNSFQLGFCNTNENVVFGENALQNVTGNFYFRTNSAPPYSIL